MLFQNISQEIKISSKVEIHFLYAWKIISKFHESGLENANISLPFTCALNKKRIIELACSAVFGNISQAFFASLWTETFTSQK